MAWDGPLVVLTSRSQRERERDPRRRHPGLPSRRDRRRHEDARQGDGPDRHASRSLRAIATTLGALKLTIQQFYRPGGLSTQLRGVIPDVILPAVTSELETGEEELAQALALRSGRALEVHSRRRRERRFRQAARRGRHASAAPPPTTSRNWNRARPSIASRSRPVVFRSRRRPSARSAPSRKPPSDDEPFRATGTGSSGTATSTRFWQSPSISCSSRARRAAAPVCRDPRAEAAGSASV